MAGRLTVVVAVAVLSTACADEPRAWDPAVVFDAIGAEVEATGIAELDCPGVDTLDPELGGSFDCAGTLNGDGVDLAVSVAPAVEGELDIAADLLTPVFDVSAVESAAAARLDAELGGSPEVDCAERLVVITPGRRIECRVTAAGGTAGPVDTTAAIVILDAAANWEIDLFG